MSAIITLLKFLFATAATVIVVSAVTIMGLVYLMAGMG